jgi:hypothetical protein
MIEEMPYVGHLICSLIQQYNFQNASTSNCMLHMILQDSSVRYRSLILSIERQTASFSPLLDCWRICRYFPSISFRDPSRQVLSIYIRTHWRTAASSYVGLLFLSREALPSGYSQNHPQMSSAGKLTLKCITRCSVPVLSFRILDLSTFSRQFASCKWLDLRYRPCSSPFIPRWFSVGCDLLAVSQKLCTSRILFHPIHGSIEVTRFTIEREYLCIHNICHSSLPEYQHLCWENGA